MATNNDDWSKGGDDERQLAAQTNGMMEMAGKREIAEVRAMVISAREFPRDELVSQKRILTACSRLELAEDAIYNFPRGGAPVRGPSIRLAEVIAQNWGNLDFGFTVLESTPTYSVVRAYCWDMETNTRQKRDWTVPHARYSREKGRQLLDDKKTDPRDIYELVANAAMRRVRATILGIVPPDVVSKAVKACEETIKKGDGSPISDRIPRMLKQFEEIGISKERIEARLKHPLKDTLAQELVDLMSVFKAIRDGVATKETYFPPESKDVPEGKKEEKGVDTPDKKDETAPPKTDESGGDDKGAPEGDEALKREEAAIASEQQLALLKTTCTTQNVPYDELIEKTIGLKDFSVGDLTMTPEQFGECLQAAIKAGQSKGRKK